MTSSSDCRSVTDDRAYRCVDIRFHKMYRRRAEALSFTPYFAALSDYLGFFKGKLLKLGHYDSVARSLYLLKCRLYAAVLALDLIEFLEQRQEITLALDFYSCRLAEYLVEQAAVQISAVMVTAPLPRSTRAYLCAHDMRTLCYRLRRKLSLAHKTDILCRVSDTTEYLLPESVSLFERIYPACHADIYLLYREREQYLADYGAYILLAKIKTVHGHYLCVIALGKFTRKFFSLGGIGILRVEYDHKRLSEFAQFIYDTLLALLVLTSRNVRNKAVRGNNKTYRGVLGDHLLRTDPRQPY